MHTTIAVILIFSAFFSFTESRFLAGSISWTAEENVVTFQLRTSWRRSSLHCDDFAQVDCIVAAESDKYVGVGDEIIVEDRGAGTNFYFGDGASTGFRIKVEHIDQENDIVSGNTVITHVYATSTDLSGNPWKAGLKGCCRPFANKDNWAATIFGDVHLQRSTESLRTPCVATTTAEEQLEVYQHCRTDTFTGRQYYLGLGLNNNPRGNFHITTTVDLGQAEKPVAHVDGKLKRRSPVVITPVIERVPLDEVHNFQLYAYHLDDVEVAFRLGNSDEMGGIPNGGQGGAVAPQQPPGLSVSSSGLVTFDSRNRQLGYWHTTLSVESKASQTSVVADFILEIVDNNCNTPPLLISPTPGKSITGEPAEGRVITGTCNLPVTFTIRAADPNTNEKETVRLERMFEPSSTEFPWRPLYTPSSSLTGLPPQSMEFSWTVPCESMDRVGPFEVCFRAVDSDGCHSQSKCCASNGTCGTFELYNPSESIPDFLNPSVSSSAFCESLPFAYPADNTFRGETKFLNASSKRATMWSALHCVRVSWLNNTGCMNPIAKNYDPLANVDDGSCVIPILTSPNKSPSFASIPVQKVVRKEHFLHQDSEIPELEVSTFGDRFAEICAYTEFDLFLDTFTNRPTTFEVVINVTDTDNSDPLQIEVFGGKAAGLVNGDPKAETTLYNSGSAAKYQHIPLVGTRYFLFNDSFEEIINTCVSIYEWEVRPNDLHALNNETHQGGSAFSPSNETFSLKVHTPPTLFVSDYPSPSPAAEANVRDVHVTAYATEKLTLQIHAFDCNGGHVSLLVLEDPGLPNGADLSDEVVGNGKTSSDTIRTLRWTPSISQAGKSYRACFIGKKETGFCHSDGWYSPYIMCVEVDVKGPTVQWDSGIVPRDTEFSTAVGCETHIEIGAYDSLGYCVTVEPLDFLPESIRIEENCTDLNEGSAECFGNSLSVASNLHAVSNCRKWIIHKPQKGDEGSAHEVCFVGKDNLGRSQTATVCYTFRTRLCRVCPRGKRFFLKNIRKEFYVDSLWFALWNLNGNDDGDPATATINDYDTIITSSAAVHPLGSLGISPIISESEIAIGPVYQCRRGDSLALLASRFQTSEELLIDANPHLRPSEEDGHDFEVGQDICLPLCTTTTKDLEYA